MKKLGTLLLACVLSLSLVGCGNSETNQGEGTKANVSGKVVLEGSTSMEKLMNALKEAIREDYPELSLEPQFTGSGSGIKRLPLGKWILVILQEL